MTFSTIGTDTQTGAPVRLYKKHRPQGTYLIGATGAGKSGLFENLIRQDIEQQIGVIVFDPHGKLITNVISCLSDKEVKRVILLDMTDDTLFPGFNIYQCDDPTNDTLVEKTRARVEHIFNLVWSNLDDRPNVKQGIRNTAYTLIDSYPSCNGTMLELPLLFEDKALRNTVISRLKEEDQKWWSQFDRYNTPKKDGQGYYDYNMVVNKIEGYTRNRLLRRVIGQSKSTIDFYKELSSKPGKIILIKLPGDDEERCELLGSLIIAQILLAALAREGDENLKQAHIYCDEFQRFPTRDFTRLLTECRKYLIGTTIAHQARGLLDELNRAATLQVGNIIVGRVIPDDAKDLVGLFKVEPQEKPGRFRPGRMRYEMLMEPETETVIVTGFDSSEHEKQYADLVDRYNKLQRGWHYFKDRFLVWDHKLYDARPESEKEIADLELYELLDAIARQNMHLLGKSYERYARLNSWTREVLGYDKGSDALVLKEAEECLLWEFDWQFNPDFSDKRVQDYLLQTIYAPGSTLEHATLRNPQQVEYSFPDLPTPYEKRIQQYFDDLLKYPSTAYTNLPPAPVATPLEAYAIYAKGFEWDVAAFERNTRIHPESAKINIWKNNFSVLTKANSCSDRIFFGDHLLVAHAIFIAKFCYGETFPDGTHYPGFFALKKQAVYRFDPSGNVEGYAQKWSSRPEDAKWRNDKTNFSVRDTPSFPVELIIKAEHIFPDRDAPSVLDSIEGKHSFLDATFGYWYPTRFPEVREWYRKTELLINEECFRYRAEMDEIYEKHWLQDVPQERVVPGQYKPVSTHKWRGGGRYGHEERSSLYEPVQEPGEYIPGGWESMNDAQKRVEQEIANLDDFTAKVRIKNEDGKLVECTIKTLAPEKGVYGRLLDARIDYIKEQNRDAGYLRTKADVDQEIAQRQALLRQSAQPQEQKVPQPLKIETPQQQRKKMRIPLDTQPVQPTAASDSQLEQAIDALTPARWQQDIKDGLIDDTVTFAAWYTQEVKKLLKQG